MEKLRLGIIGCGGMMSNHVRGFSEVEGMEVTAVCDIILERAEKVAEVLGNHPYITPDYTTMVDYVDAVLVVLPHHLHYTCGMFFAKHQKHVMMEKPLCNCEEECVGLIEECETQGVVLMCAYPVRYWPGVVKLKELVDSGEYGQVIQMSVWTEQLTIPSEFGWARDLRLGGGQFFSHGCHYVDVMCWFLGKPVRGSHFGTKAGTPWMMREGTSAAVFEFENGALGYHGATWGARGTRMGYDFQIQTEKGLLEYDHHKGVVLLYNQNGEHKPGFEENNAYEVLWERGTGISKETQHEMSHFVDCVKNGKKPLTDGRSALEGLRIIWKMYEAEKNNVVAVF